MLVAEPSWQAGGSGGDRIAPAAASALSVVVCVFALIDDECWFHLISRNLRDHDD